MALRASILLCSIAVAAAASGTCSSNCYKASCDYWDGGFWGTCGSLSSTWGCDCSGCECDGCPQSSCSHPKFDPAKCPNSGSASCDESENNEECAYDGGDCCRSTCVGSNCGMRGYNCKDPNADETRFNDHFEKSTNLGVKASAGAITSTLTTTTITTTVTTTPSQQSSTTMLVPMLNLANTSNGTIQKSNVSKWTLEGELKTRIQAITDPSETISGSTSMTLSAGLVALVGYVMLFSK